MTLSNSSRAYEAIQRIYRPAVVACIRRCLRDRYGEEQAAVQLHRPFTREVWAGIEEAARSSRDTAMIETGPADDFDLLDVTNIHTVLEAEFETLVPRAAELPMRRRKELRRNLIAWAEMVKSARNPLSHPASDDLSAVELNRCLVAAEAVLRELDPTAADRIAAEMVGTGGSPATLRSERDVYLASVRADLGEANLAFALSLGVHAAGRKLADLFVEPAATLRGQARSRPEGLLFPLPDPGAYGLLREHSRLVVLGAPGSGKTTLVTRLALDVAAGRETFGGLPRWVPVVLRASSFAARARRSIDLTLHGFIMGRGRSDRFAPVFNEALCAGRCVLIVDGFDEIPDPAGRARVAAELERLVGDFPDNHFVVTARPGGYRDAPLGAGFQVCELKPFNEQRINAFLERWFGDNEPAGAAALAAALQRDRLLLELAGDPLLLTGMAAMYEENGSLPRLRAEVYAALTYLLCDVWPLRSGRPSLEPEDLVALEEVAGEAIAQDLGDLWQEPRLRQQLMRSIRDIDGYADPVVRSRAKSSTQRLRYNEGIFGEVGVEPAVGRLYGFRHREFRDYFAGRRLARLHGRGQLDLTRIARDVRWHDSILMMLEELALRVPGQAESALLALLALEAPLERHLGTGLQLAVESLARGISVDPSTRRAIVDEAIAAGLSTPDAVLWSALSSRLTTVLAAGLGTHAAALAPAEGDGVSRVARKAWLRWAAGERDDELLAAIGRAMATPDCEIPTDWELAQCLFRRDIALDTTIFDDAFDPPPNPLPDRIWSVAPYLICGARREAKDVTRPAVLRLRAAGTAVGSLDDVLDTTYPHSLEPDIWALNQLRFEALTADQMLVVWAHPVLPELVRADALWGLGIDIPPETLTQLAGIALSDPDRERREAALEILDLYGNHARLMWTVNHPAGADPPWTVTLRSIALHEPDPFLRYRAIATLWMPPDPQGSVTLQDEVLEAGLTDADPRVRFLTLTTIKVGARIMREHPKAARHSERASVPWLQVRDRLSDEHRAVQAEAARALFLSGQWDQSPFALFGPNGISGTLLDAADLVALVKALVELEPRMHSQAELETLGEQINALLRADLIDDETDEGDPESFYALDPHPQLAQHVWPLVSADTPSTRRWAAALWSALRGEEPAHDRVALLLEHPDESCRASGVRALRSAEIVDPELVERAIDAITGRDGPAVAHLAGLLMPSAPNDAWAVAVRHLEHILAESEPRPGAYALARALIPTGGGDSADDVGQYPEPDE